MARASKSTVDLSLFPDGVAPVAQGKGKIRPRARLLRTIGAELISSEVVAVIELVRNSYDADANRVDLVFNYPEDSEQATLEIRDDGHGMPREVVLGPWLEPATDHKKMDGDGGTGGARSPGGRRRLGSKGVGRFAVQRLGDSLELRTRAVGSMTEVVAWFDWRALESGQYLDELRIPWREHQSTEIPSHGTHLVISDLRDRWSSDRFDKLRLGLSRLISPTMAEDFRILITINGAREEVSPALDAESAMYSIRGSVEDGGACTIQYQDINGDHEVWERHVLWPEDSHEKCGPFNFQISAWDLDSAPLRHFLKLKTDGRMGLRDFRRAIRDHSGISLYRDGFRILPYGEPDNDWLRLDRRRVNNPTMRLSNNQVLGVINLTADDNPDLQDQTNREGLVTNEAYSHLQAVVLELLSYFETRRFAARRAMDIQWKRASALPALDESHADAMDALLRSISGNGKDSAEDLNRLKTAFEELRNGTAETVRYYAGLASVGQLSGLVFRQLNHPIRQAKSELDLALDDLGQGLDEESLGDVRESVRKAVQHLTTMEARMAELDPLAIGGRGRRVNEVLLHDALAEVLSVYSGECDRLGVAIDFRGDRKLKVKTNREVAQHALAGLLDNAVWWARQGDTSSPIVKIRFSKSGFTVSDNGPGVPERIGKTVFEPHFTTREGASGLGLTLVRDLLNTVGGRVRLKSCSPATFQVQFER